MKKLSNVLMGCFAVALSLMTGLAKAETEYANGYTWTYRIIGDTAEIYYDNGYVAVSPKPTGVVTVPSMLGGMRVTSIGDGAFSGCSGLTSVTIPNSVTSIGSSAFSGCSGLTSVTLPFVGARRGNSGSFFDSVFVYIFGTSSYSGGTEVSLRDSSSYESRSYYIPSGLKKVVITDETILGDCAFSGCSGLTSVMIPSSVTSIGSSAFSGCSGLTSVTIGNGVTSIGDYAFYSCHGLTSVTIGNSVTSIGSYAFENCIGLTGALTIGSGVTSIGKEAFYNCSRLTSVTMGNSITNIGDYAFSGCRGLTSVTIGNSVTSIGKSAFSYCSGLTSVTIPDSVTSIGDYAFYSCRGLTSVTIGNSVTSIGSYAFEDCSGLTSVTIPNSIASVPDYAFSNCSGLTNVTIPNSVTSLGREAFSGCSGLTSISIPESVTYFGASCFEGCPVYTLPLYRMVLGVGGSSGGGTSGGGSAEPVDPRYALAASPADRAIASVTVDRDCAIDGFVLKDGKVYDTVLRIVNTASRDVRLTLPSGYVYEKFKGTSPLSIPPNSTNMLTITRTADRVFMVSREEMEAAQ